MRIHIHEHESPVPVPEPKPENKNIVKALYKALPRGNSEMVAQLLASDHLEWRYHGPPNCHHMMLTLTGKSTRHGDRRGQPFRFKPRRIKAVGDLVIAEGWEESEEEAYWVHVWTVKDGKITQFREYFNTWLTVILQAPEAEADAGEEEKNVKLWQSEPQQRLHRSLPDLMLAVIL